MEGASSSSQKEIRSYDPNDPDADHFKAALQATSMGLKEQAVICFRY
jgi:hypothetical protein